MAVRTSYQLEDRYRQQSGRVYVTGTQALVRLPLVQHQRDWAAGLHTAGFVSGYPGSPLGGYDQALHQGRRFLEEHDVHFQPGLNEDLAATSVWGTQQASIMQGMRYDGVFAIWYGKGPGVDRSVDALKHGNQAGASPRGGVLVLAGDDHGSRSSTTAHQSDHAFIHCLMPYLHPATVQEYLDYGIHGWELSRFSGCWVGFKCVTDVIESGASVSVDIDRIAPVLPEAAAPRAGRNLARGLQGKVAEEMLLEYRLPAVQAFVRANELDRVVVGGARRTLGIVTTGKAYLDVRAALDALGIDEARAALLGLAVYKVAMPWPLEPTRIGEFAAQCDEVLVVEEKRPVIEDQLARVLVNLPRRPVLVGKTDEQGAPLVAQRGELVPSAVAKVIADRLCRLVEAPDIAERIRPRTVIAVQAAEPASDLNRRPAFCSGCPHNLSTKLPDGSVAFGGIGCHGMAMSMPDRPTVAVTQMGGEGAGWIGMAPFLDTTHVFQNLGDGTYFHSGLLAIRAAVAAGVNITYKILANGAIAMTGGQQIQGEVSAPEIARQVAAEGVARVVVLSDDPQRWKGQALPAGVKVLDRGRLDAVQRELREVPGTTVIIYEQECAAEKRRKRKRGTAPDPDLRVVINERVCEGCGDCSVQSNCISIEPVETEFGRKRRINQSSCNKDYSCLLGYCPSFVTVKGAKLRTSAAVLPPLPAAAAALPAPTVAPSAAPCSVLLAGIGGTGIVTMGALVGMAAHLEGKGVTVLDVAGLAQKNGPVTSHIRVYDDADEVHATRIEARGADVLIGADIVVAAGQECLATVADGRTALVVNDHVAPTADFARNPDLDLSSARMQRALDRAAGAPGAFLPATELAEALLGDAIYTNMLLLGVASQLGRLPVSVEALERAIELNGVSVELNRRAFTWGRMAAHDLPSVQAVAAATVPDVLRDPIAAQTLDELVARRVADLIDYQDARYAQRYEQTVAKVRAAERDRVPGSEVLTRAVATYLYKLMAYKDEYEVARLMGDTAFWRGLAEQFEGKLRVEFQLAPQILNPRDPATGRSKKRTFGPWLRPGLALLAKGKRVRGTWLDVFGRTAHRREERALIGNYEATVDELLAGLAADNVELAVEIASIPEHIRGYDLVKDSHLRDACEREAELLQKFREGISA